MKLPAWPVRNVAVATISPWYTATIRKVPSSLAVEPGCEPYNSAMLRVIGMITPPAREVLEGIIVARDRSLRINAKATPLEVEPKKRTNTRATRFASPVSISTCAISSAPTTSQTDGVANPERALSRVIVPVHTAATRARKITAPPGSGRRISPAMAEQNTPSSFQPSSSTESGLGSSQ